MLEEDNMIVATWYNELGNLQKEFDVSYCLIFECSITDYFFRIKFCSLIMRRYCNRKYLGSMIRDTLRPLYSSTSFKDNTAARC